MTKSQGLQTFWGDEQLFQQTRERENVYIEPTAVCGARGSDKAALQVIHILQTEFGRRVRSFCGAPEKCDATILPFITTGLVKYPSGIFRVLPPPENASARQAMERTLVLQRNQWLMGVPRIICINPSKLDVGGAFVASYNQMREALTNFCTAPPVRVDPLSHLRPQEKKEYRKRKAHEQRRDELLC